MLYFPQRMRAGDVPNVDFLHLYGPGALHVLMGWYKVFGDTIAAERTFGLLQHLGIIFGLFALARPWGRAAAAAVASLSVFYILTPIGLTAMAWNGGLRADAVERGVRRSAACTLDEPRRQRVAGSSPAPWPVSRSRTAPTWRSRSGSSSAGWCVTQRDARPPSRSAGSSACCRCGSTSRSPVPAASFRGMFLDPVFELRAGRELPAHRRGIASTAPCRRSPRPRRRGGRSRTSRPRTGSSCGSSRCSSCTALLLAFAVWQRRRASAVVDGRSTVLLVVALVSVGILPQALQRPDSTHLTWVTCISWPFAIVAVAEVVRRVGRPCRCGPGSPSAPPVALVLTFTLTSLFTFRYYVLHTRVGLGLRACEPFEVQRNGSACSISGRRGRAGEPAGRSTTSTELAEPGERLFVGPHVLAARSTAT